MADTWKIDLDKELGYGITGRRAVELGEDAEYPRIAAAVFHFDKLTPEEQRVVIQHKKQELKDAEQERKNLYAEAKKSADLRRELHLRPGEMNPFPVKKKQNAETIQMIQNSIARLEEKANTSKPASKSKEPFKHIWEMTKDELQYLPLFAHKYGKTYDDWYDDYKAIGWPEGWQYNKRGGYTEKTGYGAVLRAAIDKGKPVPPEVLKNYPELVKKDYPAPKNPITLRKDPVQRVRGGGTYQVEIVGDINDLSIARLRSYQELAGSSIKPTTHLQDDLVELIFTFDTKTAAEGAIERLKGHPDFYKKVDAKPEPEPPTELISPAEASESASTLSHFGHQKARRQKTRRKTGNTVSGMKSLRK